MTVQGQHPGRHRPGRGGRPEAPKSCIAASPRVRSSAGSCSPTISWSRARICSNGLLHVGLKRVVPEALKPRRIAIGNAASRAGDRQRPQQARRHRRPDGRNRPRRWSGRAAAAAAWAGITGPVFRPHLVAHLVSKKASAALRWLCLRRDIGLDPGDLGLAARRYSRAAPRSRACPAPGVPAARRCRAGVVIVAAIASSSFAARRPQARRMSTDRSCLPPTKPLTACFGIVISPLCARVSLIDDASSAHAAIVGLSAPGVTEKCDSHDPAPDA